MTINEVTMQRPLRLSSELNNVDIIIAGHKHRPTVLVAIGTPVSESLGPIPSNFTGFGVFEFWLVWSPASFNCKRTESTPFTTAGRLSLAAAGALALGALRCTELESSPARSTGNYYYRNYLWMNYIVVQRLYHIQAIYFYFYFIIQVTCIRHR